MVHPLRLATLAVFALVGLAGAQAPPGWQGFRDENVALGTQRYTFGTPAGPEAYETTNQNYYDGDFADFDGDGLPDRALGSRYGLLRNTGGGWMEPFTGYTNFRFRGNPGSTGINGEDAMQWADVDNDGDFDILQGGNFEVLSCQTNQAGRFSLKWLKGSPGSALNIVNTDIDRDGDVDFVASFGQFPPGVGGEFSLWVNDGTGNFTEQAASRGLLYNGSPHSIMGIVSGDVDGDGDFDLILGDRNNVDPNQDKVIVAINDGTGRFTPRDYLSFSPPQTGFDQGMNLGDIDNDGDLDLVICYPISGGRFQGNHPQVAHGVYINNGSGTFAEESATRFSLAGFDPTGRFAENKITGGNGKLVDVDYDGDLDLVAYNRGDRHFNVFLNNGAGVFTYDIVHSMIFPGIGTATGADVDVTDLNGDGTYDIWVGDAGTIVRPLINTYVAPGGLRADVPRNLAVASVGGGGITLSWNAPLFASNARYYKVSRSTAPGLAARDRKVIKYVGHRHQDEGFSAPITRHMTTAYLNDPDVTLNGAANEIRFTDRTAAAGVTYYYTVTHVGGENTESRPAVEVNAAVAPAGGTDATAPQLEILSPTAQDWSAHPRIVLNYADGGSGIDLATLHVSFNQPLGAGVRAAGADVSDLFFRKDGGAYIGALGPTVGLPGSTLVTLTARISDRVGNTTTKTVTFFVSVVSAQRPTAVISASPTSGGAPLTVSFSGSGSSDAGGKVFSWEWYFGDGTTAVGQTTSKTYAVAGTYTATLRVMDNEGGVAVATQTTTVGGGGPTPGTLQFSVATTSVNENGGQATITATRTGGSSGAVSVSYATTNGTAVAGSDYAVSTGALSWAAGDTALKTFTVPVTDDASVEGNETVTLTLSGPTGGAMLGTPNTATLTIVDNDAPPVTPGTLQFSASTASVNEGGGQATITVTRTGGSSGAVSVSYATSNGTAVAGSDYTAGTGTLSWAAGDTAGKTFTVPIADDASVEGNEIVTLTLSGPTGGATLGTPNTATLTIVDNDTLPTTPGTLQFSASTYSVNEGGGQATITVTRTGGSSGAVSVSYATSNGTASAGSDYTAGTGTLSWAAGDAAGKTFAVPVTDDASLEGNETVTLALSGPTGGATLGTPNTATLTIVDNDTLPTTPGTLQFSAATYSVNEGGGQATITVTRTGGSSGAVSVSYATTNGTAVAASDYAVSTGTLSWADGDTVGKTLMVSVTDDSTAEGNETVNLALSGPTGGATLGNPSSATLTIVDDDSLVATPTGLVALAGDGRVTLVWTSVGGATTYTLYRASAPGVTKGNYGSLPGGMRQANATRPVVHTGLSNGTTYCFVVTASNAAGESVESIEVSATPFSGGWPIPDTDGDGYSDAAETASGSNPNDPASRPVDADSDGMADSWEQAYFGGTSAQPGSDPDGDGAIHLLEFNAQSNPLVADTDGDQVVDGQELTAGTDPLTPAGTPGGGGSPTSGSTDRKPCGFGVAASGNGNGATVLFAALLGLLSLLRGSLRGRRARGQGAGRSAEADPPGSRHDRAFLRTENDGRI